MVNRQWWFGVAVAVGLGSVTSADVSGQRLPFDESSYVRFASTDSAEQGLWAYGVVLSGSRREVLVRPVDSRVPSVVRFHNRLQLQVQRGRHSNPLVGGVIGVVAGGLLGVTVFSDVFGTNRQTEAQARTQAGLVFGAGGALVGAIMASRLGSERWVDVDLSAGYIPPAPRLADNPGEFSLRRRINRWTRFEPTERDFRAFFAAHSETLDPVEGVWERRVETMDSPHVGARRVAIVRDRGFNGYQYVMVNLAYYGDRARDPADGFIVMALRAGADATDYEVGLPNISEGGHRADLVNDLLIVRPRGGGEVHYTRSVLLTAR